MRTAPADKPDQGVAGRSRKTTNDQGRANGIAPVGFAHEDGNRQEPRDNWRRQHDADHSGVDTLGFEPDRKKRHLNAGQDEQGCVENRQARDQTCGLFSPHRVRPNPTKTLPKLAFSNAAAARRRSSAGRIKPHD